MPPIAVAEKKMPVFLPVRSICFSAYIINEGNINAIKIPRLIAAAHNNPFEPGKIIVASMLAMLPVNEMMISFPEVMRFEINIPQIRPNAIPPQKREFNNRASTGLKEYAVVAIVKIQLLKVTSAPTYNRKITAIR